MKTRISRRGALLSSLLSFSFLSTGLGQQPQKPPPETPDIIRISTELAQTSVTVLNKQNQFVAGLKPEQFELRVDGKPATITFAEHVITGSIRNTAAPANTPGSAATPTFADATARGRTIIFFIDDLHLSSAGVGQTRKALLDFVEKEMGPDDQVAVASPSGQIGFLQSFTNVKPVLRAAISRIHERPAVLPDSENIPMTEYEAIRIDQGDRDAIDYYAIELLKSTNFSIRGSGGVGPPAGGPAASVAPRGGRASGISREMAERNVKNRAQFLLRQSAAISVNTLSTLEGLMRSSSNRPGRKLLFMISDGFYLNDRNTGFSAKLRQITDAATRAGVVIYTMDAKGLAGTTNAGSNRADGDGRLARTNVGARTGLQDPLTAMAADTGGKAFLDSAAIITGMKSALIETSNYYVLAWRPPVDEQKGGKFKQIEVSIVGRPELTVRMPRGFLTDELPAATNSPTKATEPAVADTAKASANPLSDALRAASPKRGLPTQLATSFLDVPNTGLVLTASTQVATDVLGYGLDGKEAAVILAGIVLDDQGKSAGSFKTRITVKPATQAMDHAGVVYTHKLPLKPGLYQIRVAAQDEKSGRVGSAMQWIEIPDLSTKQLTLSSLLVGGQFVGRQNQTSGGPQEQVQFSVDRRFRRSSHLNFMMFIYNAAKASNGSSQLDAQIVISKNGQAVLTSPVRQVAVEPNADLARLIHGANIALQTLPVGRYLLEVKINDRVANSSATQQVMFEIE